MTHKWQNIIVSPHATIREVLKIIDKEGLKLAIVTDKKFRVLGTISDGDIRRFLLANRSLDTTASDIMNTNPQTVHKNISKEHVLELMEKKDIFCIPIVEDSVLIGLFTLKDLLNKPTYDNPVFLMAGGFGTRLRPLTDNCPKPMLKVGEKPILEVVLLSFIKAGFHNFFISTHYLPDVIQNYFGNGEKWGVSIQYVHESIPLGTGGALGLLPDDILKLPIIVMNGDILTNINFEKLLSFHNQNKANATMCVREYEYQVPYGVIENDGCNITGMVEKPTYRFHVNAGIYVVNREIVESVKKNDYIDMPTLLEKYLDKQVLMYSFYEYWLDIGRLDDYNRAQKDIKLLGNKFEK